MSKLYSTKIETPLGPMLAIADNKDLILLEFTHQKGISHDLERFKQQGYQLEDQESPPLAAIKTELNKYFDGKLTEFKTPFRLIGTAFQQEVWNELCKIPYGKTRAYAEQASLLGRPKSYRAVANANGKNRLAIIIPCHRVIASDGSLGGYGGGLENKQRLLELEASVLRKV